MDKFDGKMFEKRINDYLSLLVYASLQDLDVDGSTTYSVYLFQNYANLCNARASKTKISKAGGLKPRFSISDGVRQIIMLMFKEEIREISSVVISKDESMDSVQKTIRNTNYDCYTEFISRIAAEKNRMLGTTLCGASDVTQWFANQFISCLPKLDSVLLAQFSKQFDQFLKALAWLISLSVWYRPTGGALTNEMFYAILGQQSMPMIMITNLRDRLRPKVLRPKKSKGNTVPAAPTNTATLENAPPGVKPPEEASPVTAGSPEGDDGVMDLIGDL